ncbi:MAG: pre-peptidase C-terminal domain-containing protein, partial [Planctomycetaceae bacterium]|nr:pre-peptidase C-terminal domain-containing protein [Planctomycetaceae bacterium]
LPVTICGTVEKAEDVDFFRFALAEAGPVTFHCRAMRLEDKIHDLQTHIDPIMTIRNAKTGSTIAAADNTFAADPFLTCELPAGEFLLEVRDVRYQGNAYWNYVIEANTRPFLTNVHPTAVTRGQQTRLHLIGSGLPDQTISEIDVPADSHDRWLEVRLPLGNLTTNPIPVALTDLPVTVEADGDNNTPASAQPIAIATAMAGQIGQPADIDCFAFDAVKGDQLRVEVTARRGGSALDPIIRILNADGRALTENDDLREWNKRTSQDSLIESWTAPADGQYVVEVRDVHLRGAEDFVYLLELDRARPFYELTLDTDKTWLTPGSAAAIFVRAVRHNGFDQEIQLNIDGLPPGVTAHCGRILGGKNVDGCIVLEAAADAAMDASNVRVFGTTVTPAEVPAAESASTESAATEATPTVSPLQTVDAQPMQEVYMPGGGRSHWPVPLHTVAIGRPADLLDVRLSTYDVQLKPGESVKVDVEIIRSEGFDKNVTLDLLYQHLSSKFANPLPEGVSIDAKASQTLLTGSNTKGAITITAAKDAPAADQQLCCVMANVSINFVMKATYSSRPLLITVQTPNP